MGPFMLMRHGEKPTPDDVVRGVDESGRPDPNGLSVLGWQRAGALAALFGHPDALRQRGLKTPRHLFAPRPTASRPSARSVRTLQPLADVLGLPISLRFAVGGEHALLAELGRLDGCVLVAWQHRGIAKIAAGLAAAGQAVPGRWPEDRYDLVWLFTGRPGHCRFEQVPLRLLAGDQPAPIAAMAP